MNTTTTPENPFSKMHAALQVIVRTPAIREWLKANDPKALDQCLDALGIKRESKPSFTAVHSFVGKINVFKGDEVNVPGVGFRDVVEHAYFPEQDVTRIKWAAHELGEAERHVAFINTRSVRSTTGGVR